mgnify:FL=1
MMDGISSDDSVCGGRRGRRKRCHALLVYGIGHHDRKAVALHCYLRWALVRKNRNSRLRTGRPWMGPRCHDVSSWWSSHRNPSLTALRNCDILLVMARSLVRSAAVVCGVATLSISSACSLTDPLGGYADGQGKPSGSDAGTDVVNDVHVDACPKGFDDCDGLASNGCETNTNSSLEHCGGCHQPCLVEQGVGICLLGQCQIDSCLPGFDDCDGEVQNGCEADLSDVAHCGFCGNVCEFDNAQAVCEQATCLIDHCQPGFDDCDLDEDNGCEQDIHSSLEHCGECGKPCLPRPNSTPSCEKGSCLLKCDKGYGDCDGDHANGCESELGADVMNCGDCGHACSTAHAAPQCIGGKCVLTCEDGFASCDDDVTTGCETDIGSDPNHCGSCETDCPSAPGAQPSCVSRTCGLACLSGLGDCNAKDSDGCETDLTTHELHCGVCGRSCWGEECIEGTCPSRLLVKGLNRPTAMVLDATHVYWTDAYDNSVYSMPKSGGDKSTVASEGATGPITIYGGILYWATGLGIAKVAVNGGAKKSVVDGESLVVDLTNDGSTLFWLRPGTWSGSAYNEDGKVVRASMSGGSVLELSVDQKMPKALVVDSTHVYWVNEGTYSGLKYNNDGSVMKVAKTGGGGYYPGVCAKCAVWHRDR